MTEISFMVLLLYNINYKSEDVKVMKRIIIICCLMMIGLTACSSEKKRVKL